MKLETNEIACLMICLTAYEQSDIDISDSFAILLCKCREKLEKAVKEEQRRNHAVELAEELTRLLREGI